MYVTSGYMYMYVPHSDEFCVSVLNVGYAALLYTGTDLKCK